MERRTGPVTGVVKPPLAPKPNFIPIQNIVPQALDLDHSHTPINTVKYARVSQPYQSKALKPEWKPVAVFTSEHQSLFKEQLESTKDFKYKPEINSGQASATIPHNVLEFSDNQLKPVQITDGQSYRTVKNNLNLTNGSGYSERNVSSITYVAHNSSPTGLQPKSTDPKPELFKNTRSHQRRHSADDQNGTLSSDQLSVQKAPPIPVGNKPKSSHVGQPEKPYITSQQSGGIGKKKYKALTVNENTLALVYKEGRAVTPRKQKKSRSRLDTQNDNVELPGHYPRWNRLSSDQRTDQEVPNNTTSESTPGKKYGSALKPKVKSLNQADLNPSDGQRKSSFKKLKDFEFSVKKLFSKGGHGQESTPGKEEQSVDEGWHVTKNENRSQFQIPQYRTHHVSIPYDDFTVEHSVDGDGVENEHLYEDRPENINAGASGIQTQQTPPIWQRNISNQEERMNRKTQFIGEFNTRVRQDYNESHVDDFDDVHSEREFESSSEEEEGEDVANSPNNWKNQYSKKRKLSHIVKEIVSSEKVFVDVLKLLHINFRDAVKMASLQTGKPVIDEKNLNQILFSLPQLYELNKGLLRELEDRMAHWNEHSGIADIFLKKGPYLKMYSSYIYEFDKNVALLEELCRKNPAFAKVVQEFESSPCCANLALKHYMLKPIQRLPQYQLLLTEYFENLEEDSPDYKDAQDALNIVKEVANHANETMKRGDNFQKLMQVQCSLIGNHEIVKPGRVLLKEGTLLKLSRKVMQPRMFFLFNDALLCATTLQPGQYKLNNELSLSGMKVSKPSHEGYPNELNIESVERSFILSASSPASRDEWLEAISNAIEDYTKKMTTFHPSSKGPDEVDRDGWELGTKAPIWIPDLRATMCMICTCEFTLTWRRHHCRACGRVVCQGCSVNNLPLEYLKNRPARVCDQCFDILQQNRSEGNQASGSGLISPISKPLHFRKQKKIPAALKEVSANTDGSSISGYLERMKANKKQWKRFWFVIKDKVLYTYAASEDVAALESLPLLGFSITEDDPECAQQFQLYHKNKIFYIFKTNDPHARSRWVKAFQEAVVL
ncbi:FYVE, RhoGEF and PH domain-containing protein 6-like isoform X1 [Tachysurus fulvidraco]|uniref:FYVE, RhoGEF and PH domain-containing protein 6-like isoform X1 n=1 Tax=Tachysurus fulvidraco TaxID=1234273 RepID=UPI001FEDA32A|nr:FYVE, RhoGEF and PH domain-containing protein 6-like isoform X1 [Tachysurus fulvidraco]